MSQAGYVGVLTGMRLGNNGFSVSVNFRVTGDGFWQNLKKAMGGSWPIGFLVREVLTQSENINFNSAKSMLQNSKIIAPVYFTMSGYNKNEGCLVTRDRESDDKCLLLDCDNGNTEYGVEIRNVNPDASENKENDSDIIQDDGKRKYIIQTNIDHWSSYWADNIMWSIQRRNVANEKLVDLNGNCDYNDLWKLATEHPIFNEITVYGTLMSVTDGYLETKLPHKDYGFLDVDKDNDVDSEEWITCQNCARKYHDALNAKGECRHNGEWHRTYSDCNKLQCGWGLGSDIGKQHWGCCYSVDYDSKCKKSGKHVPIPKSVKLGVSAYKVDE